MAIDNNSTVAISIVVKDDGSIALIDAAESKLVKLQNVSVGAGSAAGRVASGFGLAGANLGAFGTSVSSTTQQLAGFTSAVLSSAQTAESAGARMADSFTHTGASIQGVRLAVQEFGLRVPRALESAIAGNAVLAGGLQATMAIFLAMGSIQIGVQMGKDLYDLYEKWIDLDAAADMYADSVKKSQQEDIVNVHSIEDAKARLDDLNTSFHTLMDYAKEAQSGALQQIFHSFETIGELNMGPGVAGGISGLIDARKAAADSSTAGEQGDKVTAESLRMTHEITLEKINAGHAADEALGKEGKITAELQKQLAINKENQEFNKRQDEFYGNRTTRDSGSALRTQQDQAAQQRAAAERTQLARQESDQVIQMQNEAVNAGVRGEALYDEQRQQAIDAVTRKFSQGEISKRTMESETEALDMRFHNAKMQRLQDEQYATLKVQQDAQQAGMARIPRIQAETKSKVADLTQNPANAGLPDADVQARRTAYEQQGDQEILQARQEFTEKIAQLEERSGDKMLAGYARIAAQEKQSIIELGKAYEEFYGKDQNAWMGYQDAKLQIQQNADRERAQYARQIDEQITQTEAEAARAYLPPWQAAQAKILDQYQQRVAKAKAALDQQAIDQQQYDREIVADSALAQAQISRQMEQTRDQVAGQLEQMFSNPAKYMENRAKQMMMDIVANWVTQLMQANPQVQGLMGGLFGMNKMGTQSNPLDAMKSMFGSHADSSTLMSAGSTLSSSGTMLAGSASRLSASATALMQAASSFSSSSSTGAGGGAGQIGQITDLMSGAAGTSGGTSIGGFGGASFASQVSSLPETGGGLSGAFSLANTVAGAAGVGGPMGAATGIASTAGSIAQMSGLFSGSTQMLNPGGAGGFGGLQATDLPPTNSAGVLGTVPDSPTSTGGADGGGLTAASGMGMAMAGISTGLGLYQAWSSGNQLGAVLTGAMGGASIGMMAGGPLGAGIGAAAGALVGFIGSLFSDHGLSQAKKYNTDVVLPSIQKEMWGFNAGSGGYDQASQDLNNLMVQAQQQCKSFGSAALNYYNDTIVGEINAAQAQVDRESRGGRSNVTMSTAQFDSGGVVSSFGDMATGPFSGLVHLRIGERVMNPMASMMHAPLLDAMNSGTAALSSMRRSMPLAGGGGNLSGDTHLHIHALDAKSFSHWARMGGAQMIQSVVNGNTARYAGKALG